MSSVKNEISQITNWTSARREILDQLDIKTEAEKLGVRFSKSRPNANGWIECHAIDREDNNASAAICVKRGEPHYGFYKDHGPSGVRLRFFELAAKMGSFHDWKDAVNHFAEKTGVPLPQKQNSKPKRLGAPVMVYDYRDESGNIVFQVCRYKPKTFRQRRIDGTGDWIYNLNGITRPLYRLPGLLQSPKKIVFIVEGEKDADRLATAGLIATCNAGGGDKWESQYTESLAGRNVVIIPDNDEQGRKHAQRVFSELNGKAARIRILELEGLQEKGDVSDWLDVGNSVDELVKLAQDAPEWKPEENSHKIFVSLEDECSLSIFTQEGQTDLANSRRFKKLHKDKCRYCHQWKKWLVWDGGRWKVDDTGALMSLAKSVADSLWHEARNGARSDTTAAFSFAARTASDRSIKAMLSLAESELAVVPDEMDQNEWLLNCPNGTVDLRTGELREHRQEDMITKLCPVEYHPHAESYVWDRFLDDVFPNQELIGFIQRLFGYFLTGVTHEHILPIFHGKGANGKSTFLESFMDILGCDYSLKAPQAMLITTNRERHPTELADLYGKRFVTCTETEENCRLNESLIKELTGGDKIRARRMKENFWQFKPTHKIVLCTNHKPNITGTDNGIWRRLRLVPFSQTFPENQQDKNLKEKLWTVSRGILAWAVQGCVEWCQNGLQTPSIITSATDEYRSGEDIVGQFIEDQCFVGQSAYKVKAGQLYDAFKQWCEDSGQDAMTQSMFGKKVSGLGYKKFKSAESGMKVSSSKN